MKYSKYLDADKKHNVFVGVGVSLGGLVCGVFNTLSALGGALSSSVHIFVGLF